MKTGWQPHLLQDDSRKLSDWFASRVDARWAVRQVCAEIERNRMSEKQPEALKFADDLDSCSFGPNKIATLLRTQHADIERKDALLRQALEMLGCTHEDDDPGHRCGHCDDYVDRNGTLRAELRKELAK